MTGGRCATCLGTTLSESHKHHRHRCHDCCMIDCICILRVSAPILYYNIICFGEMKYIKTLIFDFTYITMCTLMKVFSSL
jgi:hypothetical protein